MSFGGKSWKIRDLLENVIGQGFGDSAKEALWNFLEDPEHRGEQLHNVHMATVANAFDGSVTRLQKSGGAVYEHRVYFASGEPVEFPLTLKPLEGAVQVLGDCRRAHRLDQIEDSKRHNRLIGYERGEQREVEELKAKVLRLEGALEEARRSKR